MYPQYQLNRGVTAAAGCLLACIHCVVSMSDSASYQKGIKNLKEVLGKVDQGLWGHFYH